jgi:hypothetical protein
VEARLPQMIEEAVTRRFQTMAGKLQEQIEEQHVRTLETFVKNIQVKLVQRVSVLEQNMHHQAEAMHQLREYNQRTEDNLSRLISGVDKLANELPKRLAAAQQEENAAGPGRTVREIGSKENETSRGSGASDSPRTCVASDTSRTYTDSRMPKVSGSGKKKNLIPIVFWVVVLLAAIGFGVYQLRPDKGNPGAANAPAIIKDTTMSAPTPIAAGGTTPALSVAGADTKSKLDAAKQYMERKEYPTAEDIYKQVVSAEPNNVEALKGLASVLYREDKIEESAAVLDRLPKN